MPGSVTLTNLIAGDVVTTGPVSINTIGHLSTSGKLNAGSYTGIASVGSSLGGADAGNYSFAGLTGNYSVSQASLTASIAAGSSVYGAALSPGAVSLTGVVTGDAVSIGAATVATSGQTSTSGKLNAGTYAAAESLASPTLGGADAANYTLANPAVTGNYSVSQASLTLTYTATPLTSIYGNTPSGLTGSASAAGLVNGDVLSGSAGFATAATGTSNVGSYAITGSGLGASSNYTLTITQSAGNATALMITPRGLTITANPQTRAFGAANPVLTYVLGAVTATTGLVNGDTLSGSLATAATLASLPGLYPITQGSVAASANYTVSYIGAGLTVSPIILQPLTTFVGGVAPPYRPYSPLVPCLPSAISQYFVANAQVVITNAMGGGSCAAN